ncbi:hypothetical protein GS597_10605 [Synechococcales cyanobacterium C]|uniref:Uncharacterized protein n=1 Tax=Petrachloros mirabilis ULC683 TaxID=2781853 RepID=A0A8K2A7I7_9CYAN|nr:hypothetical protein [Petrachloros mirabilis]NCJ06951.1 hypothetical protein [Petrachloros mirabilis ULC683]
MNVKLVESIKQLILSLPSEERIWLKAQLTMEENVLEQRTVDLNIFSGVLQLQDDPLNFQRQIRDEWT